jgi:hypothetical protein
MTDEQHCVFVCHLLFLQEIIGITIRWYVILQNLNSQSDVLSRTVYLLIKYFSDSVKWTLATGS